MKFSFHHVHLLCSNLDETEQFLIEMIDARLIERTRFGAAAGSKLVLGNAAIYLRLANPSEEVDPNNRDLQFGYHHIGVAVDDVDAAYRELTAKGVVFTIPPKHTPNGSIAFFKGPDDIIVEVYQPPQ